MPRYINIAYAITGMFFKKPRFKQQIERGILYFLVDGVWTAWADWSDCSVTCANGTQWRNRTCVGPLYGGMNCTGDETQEKICVAASCPGMILFLFLLKILIII